MNKKIQYPVFALALTGSIALVSGCATFTKKSGVERAESTTTSMEKVNSDTRQASLQIDATKATLDDLLKLGQSPAAQPEDVKKSFETFSKNVDSMEDTGKDLNKHIDEMNAQGNNYFEEWAKEGGTYTNPQIQKLSEERRSRLDMSFRNMQTATAGVRAPLNSYLAEIRQIQSYLSNDLTPKGVSAVVPIAKAAERDGNRLKQSFIPVQDAIMQARADLTPGGGAAAGGARGSKQKQPDEQKKETKE